MTPSEVSTRSKQPFPFFFSRVLLRLLTNSIGTRGEGDGKKKNGTYQQAPYRSKQVALPLQGITWALLPVGKGGVDAPLLAQSQTSFLNRLQLPVFSGHALGFCVLALRTLQL